MERKIVMHDSIAPVDHETLMQFRDLTHRAMKGDVFAMVGLITIHKSKSDISLQFMTYLDHSRDLSPHGVFCMWFERQLIDCHNSGTEPNVDDLGRRAAEADWSEAVKRVNAFLSEVV